MKNALRLSAKDEFQGTLQQLHEIRGRVRRLELTEDQIRELKKQGEEILYSLNRKVMEAYID
jgi:hypothetical protein